MTFVGKILIVVQLVLSVCFMAFAGAVYTAETNWRQKSLSLTEERDRSQKASADQIELLEKAAAERDRTLGELKDQVAQLDNQRQDAENARDRLTGELEAARTAVDQQTALATIAQDQATARREEALRQRERNELLHTQVNELLTKRGELEDAVFAQNLSMDAMQAKQRRLLDELAGVRAKLAATAVADIGGGGGGYTPTASAAAGTGPPNVTGQVLNTQKDPSSSSEFVEISLGADDGFNRGDELFVFRANAYLGKIALVSVEPDTAVGRVIPQQRARNGQIQKGDYVTPKL